MDAIEPEKERIPPIASNKPSTAKLRWNLLSQALKEGTSCVQNNPHLSSTRQFISFGVLKIIERTTHNNNCIGTKIAHQNLVVKERDLKGVWYDVIAGEERRPLLEIRLLTECIPIDELVRGTDNTGNICLWPSEEVLAYYCLKNKDIFSQKVVLELGGGMTCLSGLIVSVTSDALEVILTDGNERCICNVRDIVERNSSNFGKTVVKCEHLLWGNNAHIDLMQKTIDVILCSDCIYFDNGRESLLETIWKLLKQSGMAIILAPLRGHTYELFVELASKRFEVEQRMIYDLTVWNLHETFMKTMSNIYKPELHYPRMIVLHKHH